MMDSHPAGEGLQRRDIHAVPGHAPAASQKIAVFAFVDSMPGQF